MKPMAYIAAIVAAAVGAGLWAALAYYMSVEHGLLAWGIGLMVGGASFALGGRGPASGVTAAALSIAAILAGKAIALDAGIEKAIGEEWTAELHQELMADAEAYPGSQDRARLKEFLIEREYSEDGSEAEIEAFLAEMAPSLEEWKAEKPSYETWRDEGIDEVKKSYYAEEGWFTLYKTQFSLFDVLFIALGVASAFKLAGRPEDLFSGGGAAAAFPTKGPEDTTPPAS